MKPVTVGIIAAAAGVVAVMVGYTFQETESDGPAEQIGEKIDQTLDDATGG